MFDNQLEIQKIEKSNELRSLGVNPYPHFLVKDMSIKEFRDKFAFIQDLEEKKATEEVSIAGRLKFKRVAGKSTFGNIEDESGKIQIYYSRDSIGEEDYAKFKKNLEVGDIILVKGYAFVTQTGEFSIHVSRLTLASKSISVLPEKFHGLTDIEMRYRQRYLDMIMNSEVRDDFIKRSIIISTIRNFFEKKGFLEVETPMMHPIAGGANAKPFITHHNALDVDRFLRIAPELYLKRLIVGGMEAVFEINRNFRNEGMDLTHNPEFTSIEFYWTWHNYNDAMDLTEELFATLLQKLNLPKVIEFDEVSVDFSKPFTRIKYLDAITQIGGISSEIINDKAKIIEKLKADNFEANENLDLGHLQAELFDNYVEHKLINPTFVIDFPISISPLSRRSDENPEIAERFELFIAGRELANAFNELNDPLDQYERFKAQIDAKNAGDDEAHEMDEDFVRALSYAMPPTVGWGLGVDRLVMILLNKKSIRDVILFPAMKPINSEKE
ncbi:MULTISPECIES: lysine--tRNA ligase [unclassified Campylobacter]|uniref:lysine--tRNA ligase n=1 Tax=unclassified Campylobacter TaxID=2593542 RepID=UPI0022E99A76|nr:MULTISPECIES: lysine--tRNA ligase [unclassified Campylobacter]MDA3085217.1 lysine--tRNA ligase [Campylobacter sp. CS_ED1]MDA3064794.1 lysine--tRNA ligase [Campylobacter sp. CN_NE4]MDA3068382.1 lysine--tRNA ligase [Campylobacter sp. CN_NE3]MDA3079119.1 lysine--tRNA ligase [Campylobacter sp. CS_NA2]MDA3080578.1 lysine--tRNA ligase [Campylobacter sp. CS_NA1]